MTIKDAKAAADLLSQIEYTESMLNVLIDKRGYYNKRAIVELTIWDTDGITKEVSIRLGEDEIVLLADHYRKEYDRLKAKLEQM